MSDKTERDMAVIARLVKDESDRVRDENERLKDENEQLRKELAKARDPQRIGGQADPSSFIYAIEQLREFRWQHATNDEDAIPYINNVVAAHERENDKLRKEKESLVSSLNRAEDRWLTLRDRLEGCVETWRRLEGREPEDIMLALKLMREIIETERKDGE